MYKYILFDWDGCLAQSLDVWVESCQQALAAENICATKAEVWQGWCGAGMVEHFNVARPASFKNRVTQLLAARPNIELYEGARDFLHITHQKAKLGIVSNTRSVTLHPLLARHDITHCFTAIIDDASGVKLKPHPAGIQRAMEELNATPQQTLMVGDSATDIKAANNAGIASALFYPPSHWQRYNLQTLLPHQPTYIVHSFSELSRLVI